MLKLRNLIIALAHKPLLKGYLMALFVALCAIAGFADAVQPDKPLDVPYEPTHPKVVEAMLRLAHAGPGDIHYDLGCGDGRIVIMGVKKFNVKHAYGIDINLQRLREAKEQAEVNGVADRITFNNNDIFNSDFSKANFITAYLLDHINLKLRPLLFGQLRPGTRVVTHEFHMSDWRPDIEDKNQPFARGNTIRLWIIPAAVGGEWEWTATLKNGSIPSAMKLTQEFQYIAGTIANQGGQATPIMKGRIDGKGISFTYRGVAGGQAVSIKYQGVANGDTIQGTQVWNAAGNTGTYPWLAKRKAVNVLGRWNIEVPQKNMLNGVLNLAKEGSSKLVATFYSKKGDMQIRVHDVYLWGSSVYFRLPLSYSEYILFKGEINNDAGSGTAFDMKVKEEYKEGIYDPPTVVWNAPWTATKVR